MPKHNRVFYAFPGNPPFLGETINNALDLIKKCPDIRSDGIRFTPWTDMATGGNRLIDSILQSIDRSSVFACDLTYGNPNVSFELGYAIARFKRVWISLNTSIEKAEQNYRKTFFGLTGSGYVKYDNSSDLAKAFINEAPYKNPELTLLGSRYRTLHALQETPAILYLKPPVATESVIAVTQLLQDSVFSNSVIVDDPVENPLPTLDWYASKLRAVDAILCHLLSTEEQHHLLHNAKCSLIAGMCKGFRKSTLMLVRQPFQSPIDYQTLLKLHSTTKECANTLDSWINNLSLPKRRRRRPEVTKEYKSLDLRRLSIGEPVAENESQRLDRYFVETSTYLRAMDDPVTIVVGRKGTGKSAQLYAMQTALLNDRRNHACVIKPVGYEIDGLLRVLNSILHKSERGYLIESLWKLLVYSELARSISKMLESRPPYQPPSEKENKFIAYYEKHKELLDMPFSQRLDVTVRSLSKLAEIEDAVAQHQRISELLHSNQLRDLRDVIGSALSGKQRVSILIDNLDAQWRADQYVNYLSELLWGLLQVSTDIAAEFNIADHWRIPVNLSLTVFLRSDIFAFILPTAPEQDKLPIQRITWTDSEVLKRLVDLRLEFGVESSDDAATIWGKLFCQEVAGHEVWDFVTRNVLPRPRDIVYLMREAVDSAINRGHSVVQQQDFLDAREKYSQYVVGWMLAEDDPSKGKLESILVEFAGSPKIISRSEINARLVLAGVAATDHNFYINLMCDINFFKIATTQGYKFASHEADRTMKIQIARKLAQQKGTEESYEVVPAFWQVLQMG